MVRVLIVAPAPLGARIGGIVNFIRGFVQFMPADFEAEIVGVAVADKTPGARWQEVTLFRRPQSALFLPVARLSQARRSGLIPVKARIVAGMIRHRGKIASRWAMASSYSGHGPWLRRPERAHHQGGPQRSVPSLAANSRESTWRRLGSGLRLVERFTFTRADRVFFVNRASLSQYQRALPDAANRMSFVGNGIDPALFHSLSDEDRLAGKRRLASALQVPPDDSWLIFAGRLDPQKDPPLLVRAFADYSAAPPSRPTC